MDRRSFTVVFGAYKPSKKHKQWTHDGKLVCEGMRARLIDDDNGREVGQVTLRPTDSLRDGDCLVVGNYELQIVEPYDEKINPLIRTSTVCPIVTAHAVVPTAPPPPIPKPKPFKNPLLVKQVVKQQKFEPLYPVANGELMPRPLNAGDDICDVVIDPRLVREMRPHQVAGIKFLYECIMEHRQPGVEGAILADEMGLGKTLQCISLLWTLLKQGPNGTPVVKRALIVVPATLVNNWKKEFKKWLGDERLQVFAVDGKSTTAPDFYRARDQHNGKVLIISYEQVSRNLEILQMLNYDILICDEGHRLKNQKTKAYKDLTSFGISKKIILTGTPIQNDLTELYAIVEFVNPNLLGKFNKFQRVFIDPISASREPDATEDIKDYGNLQSNHLKEILDTFVLRRTSETISKFLTSKIELVVCCKPSARQVEMYRSILGCNEVRKIMLNFNTSGNSHFAIISSLRKLCNHPSLVTMAEDDEPEDSLPSMSESLSGLLDDLPPTDVEDEALSGKLTVVMNLLDELSKTKEKIVLVSNFTKTLDILSRACVKRNYKTCRLDGSTQATKRQEIVDFFNSKNSDIFVFLLSTKAGGVGLNLIGASRLVLFDLDWNPAHDLQAMARIWRDGQKKTVHIYRLLTTGTIEEKMFQRQVVKQGLGRVVNDSSSGTKFSKEELKDLFTFADSTDSTTHDSLNCTKCAGENDALNTSSTFSDIRAKKKKSKYSVFDDEDEEESASDGKIKNMSQLKDWEHFGKEDLQIVDADCLKSSIDEGIISFIFKNKVNDTPRPASGDVQN